MTADSYRQIIAASARDRLDLFLTTANRLGAPIGNIEKDFWVCWTLDTLYHRLPANRPYRRSITQGAFDCVLLRSGIFALG